MNISVVPQVILSSERLVANITSVRSLVRVGPLVYEKVVGFGKMPPAEFADELLFGLGR